jgi:hemerythrin-like domain-containing protein
MLRDKNLIPLSHQHQHALALCVRIERAAQAGEVNLAAWQPEVQQIFEQEIRIHFEAEEKVLFPAAADHPELRSLIEELLGEHGVLRDYFHRATDGRLDLKSLQDLATKLSAHIRKEERQLFEEMQRLLPPPELAALGQSLDKALAPATQACSLPNPATQLRPKQKK